MGLQTELPRWTTRLLDDLLLLPPLLFPVVNRAVTVKWPTTLAATSFAGKARTRVSINRLHHNPRQPPVSTMDHHHQPLSQHPLRSPHRSSQNLLSLYHQQSRLHHSNHRVGRKLIEFLPIPPPLRNHQFQAKYRDRICSRQERFRQARPPSSFLRKWSKSRNPDHPSLRHLTRLCRLTSPQARDPLLDPASGPGHLCRTQALHS